ncbi:VOC family protein [Mesobacillus foraminis]|uniref:VOC family protein n=1 Tax=Mesobacillus foraminis TaxID=279826 RepID=UPI000EF4BBAC|nr:VOC family protein [Mesobacillus foraminis]
MIKTEGIHHVSLAVVHLNEAKAFYGDILGFPEIERPPFDFPGAWYQVGFQQLHLIVCPEAETLRPSRKISSRDGHFAVRVLDYDHTLNYLREKGVPVLEKPNSKSGFAQIFCSDPDGNLIEFNVEQKKSR